jgi:hypothetical protein
MTDAAKKKIEDLQNKNRILQVRLVLAQGFVGLLQKAYDALLHYGVNFRDLPEYKDDKVLEDASKMEVTEGRNIIVTWMGKVESAISAAVRRKQFRTVH